MSNEPTTPPVWGARQGLANVRECGGEVRPSELIRRNENGFIPVSYRHTKRVCNPPCEVGIKDIPHPLEPFSRGDPRRNIKHMPWNCSPLPSQPGQRVLLFTPDTFPGSSAALSEQATAMSQTTSFIGIILCQASIGGNTEPAWLALPDKQHSGLLLGSDSPVFPELVMSF